MLPHRGRGERRSCMFEGMGSGGLPRCLRKTCGLFLHTVEKPQVPAKIGRGPALPSFIACLPEQRRRYFFIHSGCNNARTSGFSRSALTIKRTGSSIRFGGFCPLSFSASDFTAS
jgi:hypothetical protein